MQVLFWPRKPCRHFLDKLDKLVGEEPAIKLVIRESADVPPSSSHTSGTTLCMHVFCVHVIYVNICILLYRQVIYIVVFSMCH